MEKKDPFVGSNPFIFSRNHFNKEMENDKKKKKNITENIEILKKRYANMKNLMMDYHNRMNEVVDNLNDIGKDLTVITNSQPKMLETLSKHESFISNFENYKTDVNDQIKKVLEVGKKMYEDLDSKIEKLSYDLNILKNRDQVKELENPHPSSDVTTNIKLLEKLEELERKLVEFTEENKKGFSKFGNESVEDKAKQAVIDWISENCYGDTYFDYNTAIVELREIINKNNISLSSNRSTWTWLQRNFSEIQIKTNEKRKKMLFIPANNKRQKL